MKTKQTTTKNPQLPFQLSPHLFILIRKDSLKDLSILTFCYFSPLILFLYPLKLGFLSPSLQPNPLCKVTHDLYRVRKSMINQSAGLHLPNYLSATLDLLITLLHRLAGIHKPWMLSRRSTDYLSSTQCWLIFISLILVLGCSGVLQHLLLSTFIFLVNSYSPSL